MEFAGFYESARDDCLRIVLLNVGDRQLAEDLVAEAFTRAWTSWRKVRRHPAPQAWVVRTALNKHVSWWRRHRREVVLGDHDIAVPADQGAAHVPKPLPPQHAAPGHATAAEVRELGRMTDGVVRFDPGNPPSVAANRFVILPSALPSGVGVQIGAAVAHTGASVGFRLVYTSPQCTGS